MLNQSLPLSLGYTVELAPDFAGLREALPPATHRVVITNPVVRGLHGAALSAELASVGLSWIEIPDGEAHKSLTTWEGVVREILRLRVDRSTQILAFGGGVVGDLAGFAAATSLRGLPFVQVPTTLLAMVDASVGGKTAVNTPEGKNLVGAFHQPRLVWAALHTLATLPPRELRCGLGEVVKHALLSGEAALCELERTAPALAAGDPRALAAAVATSVRVKAAVVEADPFEHGVRANLNLGHTFGHAVERVAGFGEVAHGEAVAIGLIAILRWAVERGLASAEYLERCLRLYAALGLSPRPPGQLDPDALLAAVGFDKKRSGAQVRLIVPRAPGEVVGQMADGEALAQLVRAGLAA